MNEERVLKSVSTMLAYSMMNTSISLQLESITQASLIDEFLVFVGDNPEKNIQDSIIEFCSKYPDVFYIPIDQDGYNRCIIATSKAVE